MAHEPGRDIKLPLLESSALIGGLFLSLMKQSLVGNKTNTQ